MFKLEIFLSKDVPDEAAARNIVNIIKTKLAEYADTLKTAVITDIKKIYPETP